MSERKFWIRFYTFLEWAGMLAVGTLYMIVAHLNDGDYLWTALWFVPLMIVIEFGCFASRDKKHECRRS